jgi:hypothetical protein
MPEPELANLYRQWAAEKLDPLHEEIRLLRRENNLMRDMVVRLAVAHHEDAVIAGLNAEIDALYRKPAP